MLVYSARNWLLVYVALKVQGNLVYGSETGYPRMRRALCGDPPTLRRSKASGTAQLLPYCQDAVSAGENWQTSPSITFSAGRIGGRSWISSERVATFEQFRYRIG